MSRVIAAVDSSAATGPVLAMARSVAPVLGADVEAVFVNGAAGKTVEASARTHRLPLTTVHGDPVEVLTGIAAAEDTVAVVIGARGRSQRGRAGHVGMDLADRTDKPVIVVPPDSVPEPELHRVVIAMEGSPSKTRSLKRAVDVTSGAGLELTVLHVDDEAGIPLFSDQVQHETDSYAREFLARYCPGAPAARLELRIGLPAEEILAAVDRVHPDLLVIGWPQGGAPGHGAVAREILGRSRTPVLLVASTETPAPG